MLALRNMNESNSFKPGKIHDKYFTNDCRVIINSQRVNSSVNSVKHIKCVAIFRCSCS